MTDKATSEALRLAAWLNEGAWHQMRLGDVEAAGRELRRQHARIAQLEAELEAVGAGGVQALSAGPAEADMFWDAEDGERFGHDIDDIISELDPGDRVKIDCAKRMPSIEVLVVADGEDVTYQIISASPTPPAEQPAMESVLVDGIAYPTPAPVAGELLRLHLELLGATTGAALGGQPAMPCVICGSDEPFTGTCGSGDPRALCKHAATKAAPGEPQDKAAFFAWWEPYQLPEYWAARIDVVAWHAWKAAMAQAASRAAPQQEAQEPVQGWPTQDQVWAAMQAFSKHDSNSEGMRAALIAGAAPQQEPVANWEQLRSALAMTILGWGSREDRTAETCYAVLDAVTEPDMPLALLRSAPDWRTRPAAPQAAPAVDEIKQALRLASEFAVGRYLMSCAEGRWDGAEKAQRHDELCRLYVAVHRGIHTDKVRRTHDADWRAVHCATQALTDHLDEVIGFPITGRPDYSSLEPKFFEHFHRLAIAALAAQGGA